MMCPYSHNKVRRYHEDIIAPALAAVSECEVPTVAMISGVCVGGGLEIACNCDLRIAADDARFGVPINRLGFPMAPSKLSNYRTIKEGILLGVGFGLYAEQDIKRQGIILR